MHRVVPPAAVTDDPAFGNVQVSAVIACTPVSSIPVRIIPVEHPLEHAARHVLLSPARDTVGIAAYIDTRRASGVIEVCA
jgi:hypothetical protein